MQSVSIGVGVILTNSKNQILFCKRKAEHGEDTYSIPGGSMEVGESIEECARREVYEETKIKIHCMEFIGVTNNLNTYKTEGTHSISIIFRSSDFSGQPSLEEPDKHAFWKWYPLDNIPLPQFESSQLAIQILMSSVNELQTPSLLEKLND